MPVASNDAEVLKMFSAPLKQATEKVIDKMEEELKSQINAALGGGGIKYRRLGEGGGLEGAWKKEAVTVAYNVFTGEMHYDNSLLSFNPSEFQHASPASYVDDDGYTHNIKNHGPVHNLADIVFKGGSGPLFGNGNWRQARDAWTPFLAACNSKYKQWWREALKSVGL